MSRPRNDVIEVLKDFERFTRISGGVTLRPYQSEAFAAVIGSIKRGEGGTFVWKFARQGGKDETLAALYQYVMCLWARFNTTIITAAPTFKPQTVLAMRRLDDRLRSNLSLKSVYRREAGHIFRVGRASTIFLSAEPGANVVGATAWPLLVMNEAQDIRPELYDKRFAPMAAADNATRLFSGTAWTNDTLLHREEQLCRLLEEQDGRRRVFRVDGEAIAAAHLPYRRFLEEQVRRYGRNHPIVRSQYFCEEIEAQGGMFNETRRALMRGDRPAAGPRPGGLYAFLIDAAGQDEARVDAELRANPGRDSTTLAIVELDLSSLAVLRAPIYRVMARYAWQGANHLDVFGRLCSLAGTWDPGHIVIDATGVGEGLWAMLGRAFPGRALGVRFNRQVKSELGWGFLSIIEQGRFRDCSAGGEGNVSADEVRLQYQKCLSEVLPGPARTLRWGVPEGTRGPDGQLVHDDHLLSDALTARLDRLEWASRSPTLMVQPVDPLREMDGRY